MNFHFSLYWLHRKGWMASKFTRLQPAWISRSNASDISQTSLKTQDHSGAKMSYCSRSGMTCCRQRSTKLLTIFANIWTNAPQPVVDIFNIHVRYELYTEIFWLNSICCFRRNLIIICVLTHCLSSNSKSSCYRCIVKGENSLSGCAWWYNFVNFRDNWIKFCYLPIDMNIQ